MKKTVIIYVNGILTWPGSADNWNGRAVTWTHLNTEFRAEDFEYACGPLTRRVWQQRRARHLAKMILFYKGWDIILAGHSNGADVIVRTLKLIPAREIKAVHLLAPACSEIPKAETVKIYAGGKDTALKIAKFSQILRCIGLGYGTIGGYSLRRLSELVGAKNVIYRPEYGHGDWWDKEVFDKTMRLITKT